MSARLEKQLHEANSSQLLKYAVNLSVYSSLSAFILKGNSSDKVVAKNRHEVFACGQQTENV